MEDLRVAGYYLNFKIASITAPSGGRANNRDRFRRVV